MMMTIQEIITKFCEQCSWTKFVYNEYCVLYEHGKDRNDLLDKTARDFFNNLHEILKEYIFLNICKLTDPPRYKQDDNLTIKYILEKIKPDIQENLGLNALSGRIHIFRNYIKDARNKIITHSDVKTISSDKILGIFPKKDNEQFWADLQEFVNKLHQHYYKSPFPLDANNGIHNAEGLVYALKKAAYFDHQNKNVLHSCLLEEKGFEYRNA